MSSGSWTLSHTSGEGGKAGLTEQTLREPWQKDHGDSHPGVLAGVTPWHQAETLERTWPRKQGLDKTT